MSLIAGVGVLDRAREVSVTDLKKSLEIMRDTVAARIWMLQEGITFYDEEKRSYYLRQYAGKLRALDQQILSLSLAIDQRCDDHGKDSSS